MRIVIGPVDDGERRISVYQTSQFEKEDEFTVAANEQAELEIKPTVESYDESITRGGDATSVVVRAKADLVERRRVAE